MSFYVALVFSVLMIVAAPEGHLYMAFMGAGIICALLNIAEEINGGKSESD